MHKQTCLGWDKIVKYRGKKINLQNAFLAVNLEFALKSVELITIWFGLSLYVLDDGDRTRDVLLSKQIIFHLIRVTVYLLELR